MKIAKIFRTSFSAQKNASKIETSLFSTLLISAVLFSFIFVLAVYILFDIPEISAAYSSVYMPSVNSFYPFLSVSSPDFLFKLVHYLTTLLNSFFHTLPTALTFFLCSLFVVSPVFEGSVRYCAYLLEEKKPLPITAILFYFTSPKRFFSCVFLSLKLIFRKIISFFMFLTLPIILFIVSLFLNSGFFLPTAFSSAAVILSALLIVLMFLLYLIYCQRYNAVRYLYALGSVKKVFKVSERLTRGRRSFFFRFNLILTLCLIPSVLIITAPYIVSKVLSLSCGAVHFCLKERKAH